MIILNIYRTNLLTLSPYETEIKMKRNIHYKLLSCEDKQCYFHLDKSIFLV